MAQIRELHGLCEEANKKIESLSKDETDTVKVTALDEELLEGLEKILPEVEKDTKDTKEPKSKAKVKKKTKKK